MCFENVSLLCLPSKVLSPFPKPQKGPSHFIPHKLKTEIERKMFMVCIIASKFGARFLQRNQISQISSALDLGDTDCTNFTFKTLRPQFKNTDKPIFAI